MPPVQFYFQTALSPIPLPTDTVVVTQSDGTSFRANLASIYSILGGLTLAMFGAVGDGTTDDTAAIQRALNACAALAESIGGSLPPTIFALAYPGSQYLCGDVEMPSYSGISIVANSANLAQAVLIQKSGTSTIIGNTEAVNGVGVVGMALRGLGSSTTCTGLNFASASRSSFAQNTFDQFGLQGMVISAGGANIINNNLAQNCLLNRAAVTTKSGVLEIGGTDSYIYENEATASVTGDYTSANLYCCGIRIFGANHTIYNNIGEISDVGIRIEGGPHRFYNNRGDLNFGPGCECTGSVQSSGNLWLTNSRHGNGAYSAFVNSGSNCQIDNDLAYSQSGAHKYGFEDTFAGDSNKNFYGPSNKSLGQTMSTYSIANFAGSAVQAVSGVAKRFAVNATTPSVDNYTDWCTVNTAPTVITNLTNGFPGQKVMIQFQDSQTSIGNGGGINTPTGSTVSFTSGQVLQLVNYNGTWIFASHNP